MAYQLLAQLYVASNRQEGAIAKLNAYVEKNKAVPALMQLAMINEQAKHFDAALPLLGPGEASAPLPALNLGVLTPARMQWPLRFRKFNNCLGGNRGPISGNR